MFERAVVNGLVALQTQHPGLYIESAAFYYRQANEAIKILKACHARKLSYPDPDPLVAPCPITFYGQRPWRAGVSGGYLADEKTEKNACVALLVNF